MKSLLLLAVFLVGFGIANQIQTNEPSNYAPTETPDRIMLTIPGNPATSRAVSWRTIFTNTTLSLRLLFFRNSNTKGASLF